MKTRMAKTRKYTLSIKEVVELALWLKEFRASKYCRLHDGWWESRPDVANELMR